MYLFRVVQTESLNNTPHLSDYLYFLSYLVIDDKKVSRTLCRMVCYTPVIHGPLATDPVLCLFFPGTWSITHVPPCPTHICSQRQSPPPRITSSFPFVKLRLTPLSTRLTL